jgi:hypothetical protein
MMATFHVRVSAQGNSLTICAQPPRCGYTVQAAHELEAFRMIDAYRDGRMWAMDAAERGEIVVLSPNV